MSEELNAGSFHEFIKEGVVVVDFFAEWCGPCKMLGPVFDDLSKEMTDVKFGKVNTEDNPTLAKEYEVRSIPYILIFKDGKQVKEIIGFKAKDALKAEIEAVM